MLTRPNSRKSQARAPSRRYRTLSNMSLSLSSKSREIFISEIRAGVIRVPLGKGAYQGSKYCLNSADSLLALGTWVAAALSFQSSRPSTFRDSCPKSSIGSTLTPLRLWAPLI